MKDIKVFSLQPKNNNLSSFLKNYCFEELTQCFNFIWEPINPDYLFVGEHIYKNKHIFKKFKSFWDDGRNKNRIFIGAMEEALKPDLNLFDYALCYDESFCVDDRVNRLLPVQYKMWLFYMPERCNALSLAEAEKILNQKTKFCNFMYSHPFLERDQLYRAISLYKKVDALGLRFHNSEFQATGYANHWKETTVLRDPYKFTIAAENGYYNGLTTEKILTAFQANSIPIYWGNPSINNDFNPKSFINASSFHKEKDLVEFIKEVDSDDSMWCRYICEPWKTEEQIKNDELRLKNYLDFFRRIFSDDLKDAKRLEYSSSIYAYQRWFWGAVPKNHSIIWRAVNHLHKRNRY